MTLTAACAAAVLVAWPAPVSTQSDLDEFMRQVMARRDENWKKLQQYVLDERETIEALGPSEAPMFGQRREYRWFIRDGFFVRSPVKYGGVDVSEAERQRYEENYYKRAKERDAKGATDDRGPGTASPPGSTDNSATTPVAPTGMDSLITQVGQPEFVNSAYFLKFKFEEGKYALVGREKFQDRDVLKIEYYPAKLFKMTGEAKPDAAKPDTAKPDRSREMNAQIERLMNKNSMVTLWVEPKERQIVKYVFDNIQLDFFPGAWLLRLEDLKASMTMSQPFKDVWLPQQVDLNMQLMLAMGPFNLKYKIEYMDYQEARTSGRIRKSGGIQ